MKKMKSSIHILTMLLNTLSLEYMIIKCLTWVEHSEDLLRFNVEYLNTLTPNGFPTHNLILKAGQPLMLLRNLNARQGLCNGTRLIYERALDNKLLICKVAGTERTVFIPRIILIPKSGEYPFGWQRRQFPVR